MINLHILALLLAAAFSQSVEAGVEQCLQLSDDRMIAQCADRYRTGGERSAGIRRQTGPLSNTSGFDERLTAVKPHAKAERKTEPTTPSIAGAKPGSVRDNSDLISLVLFAIGVSMFWVVFAAFARGTAKVAAATVVVGAAATGLTVGILEGATRGVVARYASCPFCLSVIRSRANVCKHCLRTIR